MKTQTILLSCIALFISFSAAAQFSFGLKASHHKAWQYYGDDFDVNGNGQKIKGFSTSVMAYFQLGKSIEIGMEPGYIRRGAACEPGFFISNPYLDGDASLYANYLTAPMFVRSHFAMLKNRLELFVKIGGGVSYFVDGYRELNFEWLGGPQVQDINFADEPDLNRWDFGLNGGVGIGYPLGPGLIQLEYEYYHSLSDMNNFITSKNRNRGLALGYLIRI